VRKKGDKRKEGMSILASTTIESTTPFIHPILLANRLWVPVPDELGAAGFGDESNLNLSEYALPFHACLFFIKRLSRTARFSHRMNSYSLKHSVEQWTRDQLGKHTHISNGIFIVAANYCGVKWRRIGDTPNAYFKLNSPSIPLSSLSDIEIALLKQVGRLR